MKTSLNKIYPISCFTFLWLAGCTVTPKSLDSRGVDYSEEFVRTAVNSPGLSELQGFETHWKTFDAPPTEDPLSKQMLISRGDLLRIKVFQMPELDGVYRVNSNGELEIPFLTSHIPVNGLDIKKIEQKIQRELYIKEKECKTH